MQPLGLFVSLVLYHLCGVVQSEDLFPYICSCPKDHQPVCGSDEVTYFNECFLQCRKALGKDALYHAHNGRCEDDWLFAKEEEEIPLRCGCLDVYFPVCGSDGKTYKNLCLLACQKEAKLYELHFVHYGSCVNERKLHSIGESAPCLCPAMVRPVCGSDGKTYINQCQLNCRREKTNCNLHKIKDGVCTAIQLVPRR